MTLFILFAALGPGPEPFARPVRVLSYAEMLKNSDLVIIGVFASEGADKEPLDEELRGREGVYEGVTTKLRTLAVLKGEVTEPLISIRHHRYRKDARGVMNGPSFVAFRAGIDYMVFLKKRPDGRFQCVNGQMDPALSVKRIEPRSGFSDDAQKNPLD